jgi:hypothetical protein
MTPIEPLPDEASELSCDIAEKSCVNEVAEMLGAEVEVEPEVGAVDAPPEELLPHAETMSPAPTSAAT